MSDNPAQSSITLDFKRDTIRIHKGTLDALGNPEYVLINTDYDTLALSIIADDGSTRDCIPVEYLLTNSKSAELRRSYVMQRLLWCCDTLQVGKVYRIHGRNSDIPNAIKFNLAEAEELARWVMV